MFLAVQLYHFGMSPNPTVDASWLSNPWLGIAGAVLGFVGVIVAVVLYFQAKQGNGASKQDGMTWFFAILLGFAALAVVIFQVDLLSSPGTQQASITAETALFSTLQFVLSIGFAWVLSRASFRREFAEGQKAFATAAYRRTREIEAATNRLITRTSRPRPEGSPDLKNELEVISAVALGIQQAVRFSIADWSDVIGEEIEKLEEIEQLFAGGESAGEVTGSRRSTRCVETGRIDGDL
jgi:hypothetical protein